MSGVIRFVEIQGDEGGPPTLKKIPSKINCKTMRLHSINLNSRPPIHILDHFTRRVIA